MATPSRTSTSIAQVSGQSSGQTHLTRRSGPPIVNLPAGDLPIHATILTRSDREVDDGSHAVAGPSMLSKLTVGERWIELHDGFRYVSIRSPATMRHEAPGRSPHDEAPPPNPPGLDRPWSRRPVGDGPE